MVLAWLRRLIDPSSREGGERPTAAQQRTELDVRIPKRHPLPQDREAAKQWARGLLAKPDWVLVDTDTKGLTESFQVVGAAVLTPDGRVLDEALARPKGRIPKTVTTYSGIDPTSLEAAPDFPTLHARLNQATAGKRVLAYNAAFHRRLLGRTAERYGLNWPAGWWEDVCEQWSKFVGERWEDGGDYKQQKRPGIQNRGAAQDCQNTLARIRCFGSFGYRCLSSARFLPLGRTHPSQSN